MIVLELPAVLFLSFILRCLFIFAVTTDQDFHFMYVRWCRRFGLSHPPLFNWVQSGRCGYPSMPHFFVSIFPEKYWNVVGRMLNILYDLISIIVVYGFARWTFSRVNLHAASLFPLSWAGWAAFLYATSPIMFPTSARLKAFGGRTIGHMFVTCFCAVSGAAEVTGNNLLYLLCIPLSLLTVLSSTFSSQVLVCFSAFLSLFLFTPWPFLSVVASVGMGLFLPRLDVKEILRYTLHLYRWYLQSIDKNSPIANRNKLKDLLRLPLDMIQHPIKAAMTVFQDSSFIIALYSFPQVILLAAWAVTHSSAVFSSPFSGIDGFFVSISAAGIAVFILTSFRPFIIFGQAERYLEHAAPWVCILFVWKAALLGYAYWFLLIAYINLVGILLNFIFVMGTMYLKQFSMQPEPLLNQALKELRKIQKPKVLTIPTELAYLFSGYHDDPEAKYCYDWMLEDKGGLRYMLDERHVYQYPKSDLNYFVRKYGVNTIIVLKKKMERAHQFDIHYDLNAFKTLFENEEYHIYQRISQGDG